MNSHTHSGMAQFDWIRRAFIGATGGTVSVFLDQIQPVLGAIIALLTIAYIIQQIRLSMITQKKANFDYEQGIIDRRCTGDPHECPFK